MSDDTDICGEETTDGTPCEWNEAEKGTCPFHKTDDPPEMRRTLLEEEPQVKDLIAGELSNEKTVPEACAEAGITVKQYHDWYRRGKEDTAKDIFKDFRREARRARMIAAGTDRKTVKDVAENNDDARTLWKAHMQQYGDIYSEEGAEPTGATIPFDLPDKLVEAWQQQA
jgi:hypothetical protein